MGFVKTFLLVFIYNSLKATKRKFANGGLEDPSKLIPAKIN